MKDHFTLKLEQPVTDDLKLPDWITFINDKTMVKERLVPVVDSVMDDLGLRFRATREYRPSDEDWGVEERREGLNRTYRVILQEDYDLPPGLVERIRLLPGVESLLKYTLNPASVTLGPSLRNQRIPCSATLIWSTKSRPVTSSIDWSTFNGCELNPGKYMRQRARPDPRLPRPDRAVSPKSGDDRG